MALNGSKKFHPLSPHMGKEKKTGDKSQGSSLVYCEKCRRKNLAWFLELPIKTKKNRTLR